MFHQAFDSTGRVRVPLMHSDIVIYEHHLSSPAYNDACELMNIRDSQFIYITAVSVRDVTGRI